jgi:hypothetical protein
LRVGQAKGEWEGNCVCKGSIAGGDTVSSQNLEKVNSVFLEKIQTGEPGGAGGVMGLQVWRTVV